MFNFHTHNHCKNAIINIDSITDIKIKKDYLYSIGIHPWFNKYTIHQIENQIKKNTQIIAIGECGLDKIKGKAHLTKQTETLVSQIQLSEKYLLPITLHIVKSFNEIVKIKKTYQPKQAWIIHGFNNYKQTETLLKNGFYLSFGKALLYNIKLQQSFKNIPINKIFLETDDANITIEKIYKFAADLKNTSTKSLTIQINKNLKSITNGKLA